MSSVDWKISLISSARPGMRFVFQSDMDTSSSSRYWFITIWFQMNHYRSSKEKANFIHIQGATDYKAQESDLREEKSITIYSAKFTTNYVFISSSSRFCPSLIGLAECAGEEREPWLRWQFVSSLVWHISHHWTVNHVQPFCIQWCRNVAKMHMAHNIYVKFCNDCDPWLYTPVNLGHN